MIELGDKVKCKHTGFIGVVVAKTEFINGCIQYGVIPKMAKDSKYPEEVGIDKESLEIIPSRKKVIRKSSTGGSTRKVPKQRGY